MDRDSPMGGQMQLGDMEMRPIPMATLHLMALDTQAGTLTESNCRPSWHCHKSSLVTDTSLFRQTIKLDLFAFTGAP